MARVAVRGAIVVLLALTLWLEMWFVPDAVNRIAATFPEVQPLTAPAILWAVLAATCIQAVLVIGFLLTFQSADHRPEQMSRRTGWRAMLGCLLAFLALVVAALIALTVQGYTTPGVTLLLLAAGLTAFVVIVSIVVVLGTTATVRTPRNPRYPTLT